MAANKKNSTIRAVIARILKEAALPLLCAIIWAISAYSGGKTVYEAASAAATAFALTLYIQGQILRVAKNVRDEQNFLGLRESMTEMSTTVESIREAIDLLNKAPPPQSTTPPRDVMSFVAQANVAAKEGLEFPALLVAAVGFEQALRQCAQKLGLTAIGPANQVLRRLSQKIMNGNITAELAALLRVRNEVVHATPEQVAQLHGAAATAIDRFEWGIKFLDDLAKSVER